MALQGEGAEVVGGECRFDVEYAHSCCVWTVVENDLWRHANPESQAHGDVAGDQSDSAGKRKKSLTPQVR